MRLHTQILSQVETRFEKAGLIGYRSYEVLVALLSADGHRLRLNELADKVGLTRSGLTRMADRLEKDGFLRRDRSLEDGRGVYAQICPSGREAVRAAWPTYRACVADWVGLTMNSEERLLLRRLCSRLLKAPETLVDPQEAWQ